MVQIDSSEECLHTLDERRMATYLHVLSVTVWTWCSEGRRQIFRLTMWKHGPNKADENHSQLNEATN